MPPTVPALPIPKPRLTRRGVGTAVGVGALYALATGFLVAQYDGGMLLFEPSIFPALITTGIEYGLTGLLVLPVWLLVVRGMDGAAWGWVLLAHLVLLPVFVITWYTLQAAVLGALTGEDLLGLTDVFADGQWVLFSKATEYALIFSVLHAVRAVNRLRFREAQAREWAALAQERELAALKAQLNPHFLFNALNSINATLGDRPAEARAMVVGLGDLLRFALAASERAEVPLREEIAAADAYLAIEHRRFADRLRVERDVDERALDVPVPPLVLQPLLENAVRHGLAPLERGGTVRLTARLEDGQLRIAVEDDGVGAPGGDGTDLLGRGVGLRNTDRRLRARFGDTAALRIDTPPGGGFRVGFRLPVPSDLLQTPAAREVTA